MIPSLTFPRGIITAILLLAIAFVASEETLTDIAYNYNCGDVLFSDETVKKSISAALKEYHRPILSLNIDETVDHKRYPVLYEGTLNSEKRYWFMYPILPNGEDFDPANTSNNEKYFVIFDLSGKAINMVIRAPTGITRACKRDFVTAKVAAFSLPYQPPIENHWSNGYQCGIKFISNIILALSYELMKKRILENNEELEALRMGYADENAELMIWPIYDGNNFNRAGTSFTYNYCIVVDGKYNIFNVITYTGRIVRECSRAYNQDIKSLGSSAEERMSEEKGYKCRVFFTNNYLEHRSQDAHAAYLDSAKLPYPKTHTGPPFTQQVFIWPIFPHDVRYPVLHPRNWLVVLNQQFDVICAAVKSGKTIKCCEQIPSLGDTKVETEGFQCLGGVYPIKNMLEVAKVACDRLQRKSWEYPAVYDGPAFPVAPPYYTWPLDYEDSSLKGTRISLYRLVINNKCQIAGMLYSRNKKLFKCLRAYSNSIPGGSSKIEVREKLRKHRKKSENLRKSQRYRLG